MYEFVKLKRTYEDESTGQWLFKPSDNGQILEHFEKYVIPYINEGLKQVIERALKQNNGHFTNSFAKVLDLVHSLSGKPIYEDLSKLKIDIFNSRVKPFDSGKCILLDKTPTVLIANDLFEIDEMVVKNKMIYPDEECLNVDDARYIQWSEGLHWYAKLGSLDVVDEFNNQKWNSKEEAIKAVNWFVENYIKF